MFEQFDFSLLNSPDFKEDSVREELLIPILNRLGYSASGEKKIIRSKTLSHPFVMIGSTKAKITIIPDYILLYNDIPLVVIDAKAPSIEIEKSYYMEQAYSYAIHPDIRADKYGLFNGKKLIINSIYKREPDIIISIEDIQCDFQKVEYAMLPKYILSPELKDFAPDLGLALEKSGARHGTQVIFIPFHFANFAIFENGMYTTSGCSSSDDGTKYEISIDYTDVQYKEIISYFNKDVQQVISSELSRSPFRVRLQMKYGVDISIRCHLGEPAQGKYEDFIPFILDSIISDTEPHSTIQ